MPDFKSRPYAQVLQEVQSALAGAMASTDISNIAEATLKEEIQRYITDHAIHCNIPDNQLVEYIYHDMAGLSFISRDQLFERDGFEEININAWNDIEVVVNGCRLKTEYAFLSPQQAVDIHQRMFRKTNTVFNDAQPRATADIGNGIRITALKVPLVDADVAVASSIRKVNMQTIDRETLLEGGTLTDQMVNFLELCILHGVSMCVSGETGSGKTTIAGCLLAEASKTLRTYTIEEGSREWNFVRNNEAGKPENSVIHTKTHPVPDNQSLNIDQEALVKDSLRFDPDIIAPGEIRGREAFEVMGVSNTGHTVITTTHSNGTLDTPERIVTLAKKAFDMSDPTLFAMVARAFPILVHMETGADHRRRVTEVREVHRYHNGEIQSTLLFAFDVEDNIYEGDNCVRVEGQFRQLAGISEGLQRRLLKKGARKSELEPFLHVPEKEG